MRLSALKVALLLAAAMTLNAAAAADEKLDLIVQQQQALAKDLDAGQHGGMTKRQVNIIRKAQVEIFAIVGNATSLEQLDIEQRMRLGNALETVNAQIKGTRLAQGEQDVCRRERATGSNQVITRCATQAERDQARDGARGYLQRPRICKPPGCGS